MLRWVRVRFDAVAAFCFICKRFCHNNLNNNKKASVCHMRSVRNKKPRCISMSSVQHVMSMVKVSS